MILHRGRSGGCTLRNNLYTTSAINSEEIMMLVVLGIRKACQT